MPYRRGSVLRRVVAAYGVGGNHVLAKPDAYPRRCREVVLLSAFAQMAVVQPLSPPTQRVLGLRHDRKSNSYVDRNGSWLRNKVVHGGYQPTQREANDALVALDDVETYVEQLIGRLSNVQRYTFAIFMMLGPVGLQHQQ